MSNANRYPKSKRRKMKRFVLDEISVVDKPAQKGAIATIMKRAADMCVGAQEGIPAMTSIEKLQSDLAAIDRKLDRILKAKDLRNQERTASYEQEVWPEGEGPEFEKEPEDQSEEGDEEDMDELEKERVYRPGRTAAEHRGDWPPGSDTPGPGERPPKGTRANGYVSDDESIDQMTPQRASQVLQPYAQGGEEDEDQLDDETLARFDATAKRLMRKDRRMSAERADLMAMARVKDAAGLSKRLNAFAKGMDAPMPVMGREREYLRRIRAAEMEQDRLRKGYSDAELFERLEKKFGASFEKNFEKNFEKYFR